MAICHPLCVYGGDWPPIRGYTGEDETMQRGILENLRPLSFGRETHVPCVGPASSPESEHSGPSWVSQGSDWPPLRGHIFHLALRRKSPCEVAESVFRRPQNTISWTGSEPENRDAVCVGFLRNSTVMPLAVSLSRQCCRWQCGQSWRSLLF